MSKDNTPPLSPEAAKTFLRNAATRIDSDPMTNSVADLAHRLFRDLESGEAKVSDLKTLKDSVALELLEARADRFRDQHYGADPVTAWKDVRTQLQVIARGGFDAFKAEIESEHGGVVFTAHPTFALSRPMRDAYAKFIAKPNKTNRAAMAKELKVDSRPANAAISLLGEHDEVQDALLNAGAAQQAYGRIVLEEARKAFPDQWADLRPRLPTLASWVGYDLDGRTDIHWSQSITFRLAEKATQMARYSRRIEDITGDKHGPAELQDIALLLRQAASETDGHARMFAADLSNPRTLIQAANALTEDNRAKILNISEITSQIEPLLDACNDEMKAELIVLLSEMKALQLGTARIHLRVNAAQIRTVINRDLGLETEDREMGRLALAALAKKATTSKPIAINFADLFQEQSTARRQFMMCAQIFKHIDSGSDIRFLIAESENPATVMGALYLARQYGVADQLDISPLFETPEALETGGRFIERLLEEKEFVSYIRQRGYLSVQLGFSDAGRFIGQVAADMAIERIHNLIARAIYKKGEKVDLLIFNTHGESMGRGAWPGNFRQRFDHLLTPWTRMGARQRGLKLRHEVSFQGGDGFLHYATPELAETTHAAYCAHMLSEPPETAKTDPFYTRTDLVWDFYRALRKWHEGLFVSPNYGRLLDAFSNSLTVKAGSRQKRRKAGPSGPSGPRALRAISHNATLQQLGLPANTAAGIGSSLQREMERLVHLIDASPRMRSLIYLALNARMLTSLPALRGYARVYDPSIWIAQGHNAPPQQAAAYRSVYYTLRDDETFIALDRIANAMSIDLVKFDRLLAQLDDAPSVSERHESRLGLHVLHAARQALMMKALSLVASLPRISERHDASTRDIVSMVSELRITETVALLTDIFPCADETTATFDELTEIASTSTPGASYGYEKIHRDVIEPLDEIGGQLHAISLAITHAYGAFG
ncbi:MAG: phosphoenolpyruvate carboxylase [Hyphomonas sp.]